MLNSNQGYPPPEVEKAFNDSWMQDPANSQFLTHIKQWCRWAEPAPTNLVSIDVSLPKPVTATTKEISMDTPAVETPAIETAPLAVDLQDPVFQHPTDEQLMNEVIEEFRKKKAGFHVYSVEQILQNAQDKVDARAAYERAMAKRRDAQEKAAKVAGHIEALRELIATDKEVLDHDTKALFILPNGSHSVVTDVQLLRGTKLLALAWLRQPTPEERELVKPSLGIEIFVHTVN